MNQEINERGELLTMQHTKEELEQGLAELQAKRQRAADGERNNPELERRFVYHAPKGDQPIRYARIREAAKNLAYLIDEACPNSREKSLAWTHLEDAVYCANAAIARNE